MTSDGHLLRLEGLCIDYRQGRNWHPAVHDVSLTLDAGEILAIAGESGSGKSTVAQALLGLGQENARASGGRVLFGGRDLLGLPPAELRRLRGREIAFVPQNPTTSLTPSMRIGAQITELFRFHAIAVPEGAASRAASLLAAVGLPDPATLLRRYPHELSGGQQQRVLIAMALAGAPKLIVLDEPTTGLDVTNQARILTLLRELRGKISAAMVWISHDLAALASVADRVVVMQHGRVIEEGPIAAVFTAPKAAYTRRLLDALPRLDHPPKALRAAPLSPAAALAEPVLSVRDLTIRYGEGAREVVAANRISFDIHAGEVLALVGESGSGKSSIARAVAGLQKPQGGAIHLSGAALQPLVRARRPQDRRDLQLVFQNPDASLNPRHSVGRILTRAIRAFTPLSRTEARARALELIEAVRLEPAHLDRLPSQLSGGQRQRVAIARALAANPRLILCDEILSALDVSVQAEILELLQDLRERTGVALLFISHDLAVVRWLAHRVIVLQRGENRQSGPVEEVFSPPFHGYTRSLIEALPQLPWERSPVRALAS